MRSWKEEGFGGCSRPLAREASAQEKIRCHLPGLGAGRGRAVVAGKKFSGDVAQWPR